MAQPGQLCRAAAWAAACVATAGRQGKLPAAQLSAAAGAGCPLRDSLNRKPGQQQQQQQAAGWMPPGTLPGILGEPHTAPECVPHQTIVRQEPLIGQTPLLTTRPMLSKI